MTSPAIELCQVTKRYGRAAVVDELSLQIPQGQVFGLLGPNGAGKSTTLKMLMGMLSPSAGRIQVLGIDVFGPQSRLKRHSEMKQRVGYVPELQHIYRWMRVDEVIRFARACYQRWDDELCTEMLDMFELPPRRKVKKLSKGMGAKLSLLLAVCHEPELLILDEPMSGLDPIAREEFLDGVLKVMCEQERTILFSSHSLDDVQRIADVVGILSHGKLVLHRPLDDLLASAKRIRAVLRDGTLPKHRPHGVVWERVQRREWLLTMADFSQHAVDELQDNNDLTQVEVCDLGLEDIYKDFIRGERVAR